MKKFGKLPLKSVRAEELVKYKGHRTMVQVRRETRYGKIIHVNPGVLWVYVYVLTDDGTASCGRWPRIVRIPVSVDPVS